MVTLYQEDGEAFMGRYGRRLKKLVKEAMEQGP